MHVTWTVEPGTDERHETITHLGGANWQATVAEVIDHIETKRYQFYVRGPSGKVAIVGVRIMSNGRKMLQTYADRRWDNNLLSLPRRRQCLGLAGRRSSAQLSPRQSFLTSRAPGQRLDGV